MICYITSYYDIGRDKWNNKFSRTFEDYIESFEPFIDLFNSDVCQDDEMIIFIDEKYYSELNNLIKSKKIDVNITLIILNENTMNELPMWKTLDREQEIMTQLSFRQLLFNRIIYPEHNYPKYTLINHCKIDLVCRAIELNISKNDIYAWVDFGFFGDRNNIPDRLLDITKFNLNKINYTLINPIIEVIQKDIHFNLKYAPEVIGGFFFLGSKTKLLEYQQIYHNMLDYFQNTLSICDDDQHLVLQCYFKNPDIFSFNDSNYGWHKVLKANQKQPSLDKIKVISFCLWGNDKKYTVGLIENIKLSAMLYPDWVCWIYIHEISVNKYYIRHLKQLFPDDNVKIIFKKDIEIRSTRFMLWRLEPILDLNVERFISRDIDTRIQLREVLVVNEWVKSNKILHIIRDHPQHYPKILGGMYGVKCTKKLREINWIDKIEAFYLENGESTDDQYFLEKSLYEKHFCSDRIIHDEIKRFEGDECKSFPIKFEQNGHFVGCYIYEDGTTDSQTANVLIEWLKYYLPHRLSSSHITLYDKLKFISEKISSIYIVHYTKLKERKINMNNELNRNFLNHFFKIKWVEQFDREVLTAEIINNEFEYDPVVLDRKLTLGEMANGLSHRYIYNQIYENDELAIVFEDDTMFKTDFIHHLYHILNHLPDDFESVCLGGPTDVVVYPEKLSKNSIREDFNSEDITFHKSISKAPCTLSAMLYSKKAVEKILKSKYIKKMSAPSDHLQWYCNHSQNVNIYLVQPWITYESSKNGRFKTSLDRGF